MSTLCSVVSAASAQLSALLSSLAPREIYYIGGPEPLPAPLTPAEEQSLLARLDTDGAAVRTTLIEHNPPPRCLYRPEVRQHRHHAGGSHFHRHDRAD